MNKAHGGSIVNWLHLTSKSNTPASPGGMRTQKGEGINYAGDTGSVGYICDRNERVETYQ